MAQMRAATLHERERRRIMLKDDLNLTHEVTQMLQAWGEGSSEALNELLPLVYTELRRQASRALRRERREHTLQTTALVHEAYLRLAEQRNARWQNRAHFYAIAARMMRRILVDYAKAQHREKRGGDDARVPLDETVLIANDERSIDLLALDEALTRLAAMDEQQSRIVELRYFSGMSIEETAEALGISPATVKRDWRMAKAWLHNELK
jgi:RNA polymerase sigma factor (TIGR02999 family)